MCADVLAIAEKCWGSCIQLQDWPLECPGSVNSESTRRANPPKGGDAKLPGYRAIRGAMPAGLPVTRERVS